MGITTERSLPVRRVPVRPTSRGSSPSPCSPRWHRRRVGSTSTGVLMGPLPPALFVARTVADIDVLSRGRVDLGIGTGCATGGVHDRGLSFRGRAARMERHGPRLPGVVEAGPPVSSRPTASSSPTWREPRPVPKRVPVWYAGRPERRDQRDGSSSSATVGSPSACGRYEIGRFVHRLVATTGRRDRDPSTSR